MPDTNFDEVFFFFLKKEFSPFFIFTLTMRGGRGRMEKLLSFLISFTPAHPPPPEDFSFS